jgi:dihydropyrimidine dehydrogenase (NAD+) subunit PreA
MGSAVGQEPKVLAEITRWAREATTLPVLVKLTPNVSDILDPALAAVEGGAHGLSLINTIKSLMGVDLDRLVPMPVVGGRSTNGGYCGPAVKPIALHMVAALARDPRITLPISGIGGIQTWRDAAEFIALGATGVQVCTAVMHYGFRIVEDLIDGLGRYLDDKGFASVNDLRGAAVPAFTEWGDLDMNYKVVARIDQASCIGCDLCYVACRDGAVACIHVPDRTAPGGAPGPTAPGPQPLVAGPQGMPRRPAPRIDEPACIGCNLCSHVCPVDGCISMVAIDGGKGFESWNDRVRAARA